MRKEASSKRAPAALKSLAQARIIVPPESSLNQPLFFIITAIVSGAGAYFGSYLKKKGENLATHEDIDKLLEQVSAVTKTTKEIESKISDAVWARQKQWEMKRDVIFDTIKKITRVEDTLSRMGTAYEMASKPKQTDSAEEIATNTEFKAAAVTTYDESATELEQMIPLVMLVCGAEVSRAVSKAVMASREIGQTIMDGKPEAYEKSSDLTKHLVDLLLSMREEMGISPVHKNSPHGK
jgi:hypothetical protein